MKVRFLTSETSNLKSDKVAVQQFMKGRSLVEQEGQEDAAIEALDKAIEKYDRHAQAYERRAWVNFLLKKHHDSYRDYKKRSWFRSKQSLRLLWSRQCLYKPGKI